MVKETKENSIYLLVCFCDYHDCCDGRFFSDAAFVRMIIVNFL